MTHLASTSDAGRKAALEFAGDALEACHRLSTRTDGCRVRVLELHAAPVADRNRASVSALADSLAEIAAWDWQGVRVVLEHSDAFIPGQPPAKGFMTLKAEADAVGLANERTGRSMGLVINWARSVIEQRRPEAALEHITFLRDAGLLRGLVLSGCAGVATRYGPAWADVHLPPAPRGADGGRRAVPDPHAVLLEPASLLTAGRIQECLEAAGTDPQTGFRGIKVAAQPHATVGERVATIAQTLGMARDSTVS